MCDDYRDSVVWEYDHLLLLPAANALYSQDNDSRAISVPQYRTRRSAIISFIMDFAFFNVLYCVAKVKRNYVSLCITVRGFRG